MGDPRYSAELIKQAIRDFTQTPAYRDAEAQLKQVRAVANITADFAAKERAKYTCDSSDVATQLRADRYWERMRSRLDRVNDGAYSEAVTAVMETATPEQLNVLADELPEYLATRDVPLADGWFDDALASVAPGYGATRTKAARGTGGLLFGAPGNNGMT